MALLFGRNNAQRSPMLLTQPANFARFIGMPMVLASACWSVRLAMVSVAGTGPSGDIFFGAIPIGVLAFVGEMLWAFEGGWQPLKRLLRIIITTAIGGALLVPMVVGYWLTLPY